MQTYISKSGQRASVESKESEQLAPMHRPACCVCGKPTNARLGDGRAICGTPDPLGMNACEKLLFADGKL